VKTPFAFAFTDAASGVTYEPWTNGHAVGFRCEYVTSDGHTNVEYVYLNPSTTGDGDDKPNVFLYQGVAGDPAFDTPQHWYSPYDYSLEGTVMPLYTNVPPSQQKRSKS
jgi:hypothetical protein